MTSTPGVSVLAVHLNADPSINGTALVMLATLQAQSEHGQEQEEMSCSATLNEPQLHYKPAASLGILHLRVLLLKQQSTEQEFPPLGLPDRKV